MRAAEQGITLTQLIDESLRERLASRPREAGGHMATLPTYGEGGLLSGVDLADNRALGDLMDDAPRESRSDETDRSAL